MPTATASDTLMKTNTVKDNRQPFVVSELYISLLPEENELLRLLGKEGRLTIKQCAEKLDLSYDKAKYHLKKLVEMGFLEREDGGRYDNSFWLRNTG